MSAPANRSVGSLPASLPLTPLQKGMLAYALQSPNSGCDIEQMVSTLPENRLRTAWEQAVTRHESLRVHFDWSAGEPRQFVAESIELLRHERATAPPRRRTRNCARICWPKCRTTWCHRTLL